MNRFDAKVKKQTVNGRITVPSSKSHTIRAILIGMLSKGGKSFVRNPLQSEDCKSALRCAEAFGAKITKEADCWIVESPENGIHVPDNVVDVGNSGSALYFFAAAAALLSGTTVFTGDASIRKRPVDSLLNALTNLGAKTEITRPNCTSAPFTVRGPVQAGCTKIDGKLSQYVSALLLMAPECSGKIRVETDNPMELPYLDITLSWLKKTGIEYKYDEEGYHWFEIEGNQSYQAFDYVMPSDWSTVAFPTVAGLGAGSYVEVENMDFNDPQGDAKAIDFLIEMGADIEKDFENGRLIIRGGAPLHGIEIDMTNTPDALPILSVAAAIAQGPTVLNNILGTRLKETDRAKVMAEQLTRMGVKVEEEDNRMVIHGTGKLQGAVVDSYDDHRIAMAMTVAGLYAEGETHINHAECAAVTFPEFFQKMGDMQAKIDIISMAD